MDTGNRKVLSAVAYVFPKAIMSYTQSPSTASLNLRVYREDLVELCTLLRGSLLFRLTTLLEVISVDYLSSRLRFCVKYILINKSNMYYIVSVRTDSFSPIPSLCDIYLSANWAERESFDLFGVQFSGHRDLRRILTDYSTLGHPMRKDYPLTGFSELRYDLEQKRVVSSSVELAQAYRIYSSKGGWSSARFSAV